MEKKYLEDKECLELELSQKEQKIQKLEKMLLEKELTLIKHQQEQLKLKVGLLDFEAFKVSTKISKKNEALLKQMEQAKKLHSKIEEKYEISPGWGYDPDSLELILKEN